MSKQMRELIMAVVGAALVAGSGMANNLKISNVEIKGRDNKTALVKFDISWENSWRFASDEDPLYFHDAAWVFFKVKPDGRADWEHVRLKGKGINPTDFNTGSGTAVELVVPDDGVGMFVRRSGDGAGTTSVERVTAVWNFATNGLTKTDRVNMQVFGLEVCYVAEGAFKVGDGQGDMGQFEDGQSGQPYAITNANQEILLGGGQPGTLNSHQGTGMHTKDDFKYATSKGALPPDYPNGYNSFYCMKYAITQGQYADFLNTLTRQQQATRCVVTTVGNYMSDTAGGHVAIQNRNTVRLTADAGNPLPRVYATVTPDRACNWLSWADLAAFAAWAGLRPMTELEFEKACRGPLPPVAGEFAWGTENIIQQTDHSGTDGSGMEGPLPANANCLFGNGVIKGPVRVGIYAASGASREQAGASYWGIMELSGSLWKRPVTIGNTAGRAFTGLHGNGTLSVTGEASVANWPDSGANGAGSRGGIWADVSSFSRVSDRTSAARVHDVRHRNIGGRAVRSAP